MANTTLSKKQQKKTLGNKKGHRETVKLVLANTYASYFPIISSKESNLISDLLKKLPKLQPEKPKIPFSKIKDIPKEKRKEFRKEFTEPIEIDENFKSNIIFGINEVNKSLEKNEVSAILITEDVNPQFMVKHIIDFAVLRQIPVLVVVNLRNLLKESTGISGAAFAIKNSIIEGSILFDLCEKIRNISSNYPIPSNHIHYNTSESDSEAQESLGEDLQNLDLEYEETENIKTDFHLHRDNNTYRVFNPGKTIDEIKKPCSMEVDESGFIGFLDEIKITTPVRYQGLKVKRIRNNKNRKTKLKINSK